MNTSQISIHKVALIAFCNKCETIQNSSNTEIEFPRWRVSTPKSFTIFSLLVNSRIISNIFHSIIDTRAS